MFLTSIRNIYNFKVICKSLLTCCVWDLRIFLMTKTESQTKNNLFNNLNHHL